MKSRNALILSTLREIGKEINYSIPHPNDGGCCIIAAIVSMQLKKIGVEVEVVSIDYGNYHPADYLSKIDHKNQKHGYVDAVWHYLNVNHVGVRFKLGKNTYTWDTDDLLKCCRYFGFEKSHACNYPFGKGIKPYQAIRLYNFEEDWNDLFDKADIPKIRKIVKDEFKRLVTKLNGI